MLDYTSKSSTFAYNCLSYIFMLISLCVEKKMWGKCETGWFPRLRHEKYSK